MKIAIIGAGGFLGRKLMNLLSRHHEVHGAGLIKEKGITKLDATVIQEVNSYLSKLKPDIVIDVVSLTSSLICEKNLPLAEKLNYITAKNISQVCKEYNLKMVFISSTYVFDGEKGNYSEKDSPSPLNNYGRTKAMAEKIVIKLKNYIIIRVDLMYGFNGFNLPNGVFSQILSDKSLMLSTLNQKRSPVFVDDVVRAIEKLFSQNEVGIFHISSNDTIYYSDFLKILEKVYRNKSKIHFSNNGQNYSVKVPKLATLDNSKIISKGIVPSSLREGIKKLKIQFNNLAI